MFQNIVSTINHPTFDGKLKHIQIKLKQKIANLYICKLLSTSRSRF